MTLGGVEENAGRSREKVAPLYLKKENGNRSTNSKL